jgi:hypothetical protein
MSTMTRSTHERYGDALTVLAVDTAILPIVSEVGERRGWWTSERIWHRTYGRFMPDADPFAEIVVSSETPSHELCRIEMFERRPDARGPRYAVDTGIGWARMTRFPFDPALPGLTPVSAGATVVRYHPGRRCTLRVVRDALTVFAKVYATNKGARVYEDLVALRAAASHRRLKVTIAEPLSWEAGTRTLWQAALPGEPASRRLGEPGGDGTAGRMGTATASLARASVTPSQVFDGAAALARSRRHAAELSRRVPCLSETLHEIEDRLAGIHARFPSRDLRPIHGAPHLDQWLDAGSEIGLIDFDRFSRGDPELDAGVVLGDFDALGRTELPVARLSDAFLEAYRDTRGPLCEPLVQAYRAHRHLAKALRAAQAIRPDGDRRAARVAAGAARMLTEAARA